jgi:hypothetical protein
VRYALQSDAISAESRAHLTTGFCGVAFALGAAFFGVAAASQMFPSSRRRNGFLHKWPYTD